MTRTLVHAALISQSYEKFVATVIKKNDMVAVQCVNIERKSRYTETEIVL